VRARVVSIANEIMSDGSDEPWTIFVTGHSLGGALAVLCAYELKVHSFCLKMHDRKTKHLTGMKTLGSMIQSQLTWAAL
jgi:hypothetical protein